MQFMSQEDAIAKAEAEAEERRAVARRIVQGEGPAAVSKKVSVRVLKLGHDKVSKGQHAAGYGDAYYEHNDRFEIAEDIAAGLEKRGLVEIEAVPELPQVDAAGKKA